MTTRKHLFICAATNTGSTLLHRAIFECDDSATFLCDGDAVASFHGPSPNAKKGEDVFTYGKMAKDIGNPELYDWEFNESIWNARWDRCESRKVNVEKSFSNVIRASMLTRFPSPHFIILVRNPYASIAEMISRRRRENENREQHLPTLNSSVKHIAGHYLNVLRFQARNQINDNLKSLCIRYEDICESAESTAEEIRRFVPELGDIDFAKRRSIKKREEPLTNMNQRAILALAAEDIAAINEVFQNEFNLLDRFGYDRETPKGKP